MAPPRRVRNREELEGKYASKPEAVVTVENFAHRKGIKKGLLKFRERKQSKRIQVSKALRHYKKAMKQEGYTPGKGIARKRTDENDKDENVVASSSPKSDADDEIGSKEQTTITAKKQHDRLQQTLDVSSAASARKRKHTQEQNKETENAPPERALVKEQKLQERRKRHKLLTARTYKGQPIMNNMVQDILHKLQNKRRN